MSKRSVLLRVGIVGTVVTAVCCFTPVLALGLGAIGVAVAAEWLDLVLLPVLGLFIGLTVVAAWTREPK